MIDSHEPVLRAQVALRSFLHIGRGDLGESFQVGQEPLVARKHLGMAEPEGLVGDVFRAVGEEGACLLDGPGDLCLRYEAVLDPPDLVIQGSQEFLCGMTGVDRQDQIVEEGIDRDVQAAVHGHSQLFFDQRLV